MVEFLGALGRKCSFTEQIFNGKLSHNLDFFYPVRTTLVTQRDKLK